ncbi:unnamed protein product [Trichobilharzia regenti]|nr:unnamed protein product [Trichobilharzia regenti]
MKGGDAKPSQYHQILERDNLSSQNEEEKSTPDNETICGQDSDDDDEKKDELCVDDEAEPLNSPTNPDDNHSIKSNDEKSLQDLEIEDAIDNEEFSDETKEDDLIQMLNSLTGQPYEDDLLLYAIPVCGPYSAMLKYKYRVKLNPGITKRGKASKMAMFQFTSDKSATNRERELMRAMKDEEVPRNFPGCVKITLPQGKTLKKK